MPISTSAMTAGPPSRWERGSDYRLALSGPLSSQEVGAEPGGVRHQRIGGLPLDEVTAGIEAVGPVVIGEHDGGHLVEGRVDDVVGRTEQQQRPDGVVALEPRWGALLGGVEHALVAAEGGAQLGGIAE